MSSDAQNNQHNGYSNVLLKHSINLLTLPTNVITIGSLLKKQKGNESSLFYFGNLGGIFGQIPIQSEIVPEKQIIISIPIRFLKTYLEGIIGKPISYGIQNQLETRKLTKFGCRFSDLTVDYMHPFWPEVSSVKFQNDYKSLVKDYYPIFIVTRVMWSSSISFFTDDDKTFQVISEYIRGTAENRVDLQVNLDNKREITLKWNGRLAFALNLRLLLMSILRGKMSLNFIPLSVPKADDTWPCSLVSNIKELPSSYDLDTISNKAEVEYPDLPHEYKVGSGLFRSWGGNTEFKSDHKEDISFVKSKEDMLGFGTADTISEVAPEINTHRSQDRRVNLWIEGRSLHKWLAPGKTYKLGLNIGYEKPQSLISSKADDIENLSRKIGHTIKLTVYATSKDFDIRNKITQIVFPPLGESSSVYYRIKAPEDVGLKEITVFFYYELNLIQVVSVPIEVKQVTSDHQDTQKKMSLESRVISSAKSGLNTIIQLASKK